MAKFLYPNHYKMKQNRLVRLKETKGLCEICEKPAHIVHHKDYSVDNHELDNLIVVCIKCHKVLHAEEYGFKHSKFRSIYGFSVKELAEKCHCSEQSIRYWHTKGILREIIKNGFRRSPKPKPSPPKKEKTSKFVRMYGCTLKEMAEKFGGSPSHYYNMHAYNRLTEFLQKQAS